MVRRLIRASLLVPLIVMLTGCWDRNELNDLALVTALALDVGEDNQIDTTIQFLLPRSQSGVGGTGGGGGGSGTSRDTAVRHAQGSNIADALSKLQRRLPRKLFWGQCKIFIFGQGVAKKGVQESVDFLTRHPQPRERSYVFVSDGRAADTLELFPPLERSSAEVLRELSDMNIGFKLTLEQLSIKLISDSKAFAIPYIHILQKSKSAEPQQTIPYIYGTAIMKGDRMIGAMSEKVMRGMMWINNEVGEYTVSFGMKGSSDGLISLKPITAKIKLVPSISGDKWKMKVKAHVEGDMVQNETAYNPAQPTVLVEMDKAFEEAVRKRIELCLNQAQHQFNADIFDFAGVYHRKFPKLWEREKQNWDQRFPQVEVETEITAHIARSGLILAPGGMPKEEVME
ncbi:spore germination protein KC [Paenibacillus cellulosilyticus]|uniref:Spore germination protein KC n=1 Tax=Paenibacillus cellulosilyticus TaxID=375489 RepID=A0A2V2YXZ0_9BACL|nr:Ger(x)C family spore germination protein [Paenibacillus cellulosilyticus]PWW07133.1 spore germination protein KC [Paenibacillus cellulosilyticus]QKS46476.1 Ger(x)C family spore germination protein [Paenibacillus cellulosilyticus]